MKNLPHMELHLTVLEDRALQAMNANIDRMEIAPEELRALILQVRHMRQEIRDLKSARLELNMSLERKP